MGNDQKTRQGVSDQLYRSRRQVDQEILQEEKRCRGRIWQTCITHCRGPIFGREKEYKTILKDVFSKYEENYKNQASFKTGKRHYLENFKEYFGESNLLANIIYMDLESYRNHLREKITKNKTIRSDAAVNREMSCLHLKPKTSK